MNFEIKKISSIRILSNEISKSGDWYRSFFNLDPIVDTPNFVSFKVAGVSFDITSADTNNPFSSGGSIGYWLVDNLHALLARVQDLGGEIYRGPLRVEETQRTIVQIRDPFGKIIGIESQF